MTRLNMTGLHITCDGKSAVISWFENGRFHSRHYKDQLKAIHDFDQMRQGNASHTD